MEYHIKSIRRDIYNRMEIILYGKSFVDYEGINLCEEYLSKVYGEPMTMEIPSIEKRKMYFDILLRDYIPITKLDEGQTSLDSMKSIIDWHLKLPYKRTVETVGDGKVVVSYPQFGIKIFGKKDSEDLMCTEADADLRSLFISLMIRDMRIPLPIDA